MNTFMNFVNRFLTGGETRDRMGALREIRASLLPASDFAPASLSCSLGMSDRGLTQGLCRLVQDLKAIAKERSLNVTFPNGLADPLDMKLLEL